MDQTIKMYEKQMNKKNQVNFQASSSCLTLKAIFCWKVNALEALMVSFRAGLEKAWERGEYSGLAQAASRDSML